MPTRDARRRLAEAVLECRCPREGRGRRWHRLFGLALAQRLACAGDDVAIGSRDAERAREPPRDGVEGGRTRTPSAARSGRPRDEGRRRARDRPLASPTRSATTPVLSVAAELRFDERRPPGAGGDARSRSGSPTSLDAPVVAGLHSLAARPRGDGAAGRGRPRLRRRRRAKRSCSSWPSGIIAGRAIDCGPLPTARALEGLTAVIVNVNKRYKAHAGIRVTGVP